MNQSVKVFLACSLGASIGSSISLRFEHLIVGLVVGAFAGYLSYKWREVVSPARATLREAIQWRPDKQWWKTYFHFVVNLLGFLSGLFTMCGIGMVGLIRLFDGHRLPPIHTWTPFLILGFGLWLFLTMMISLAIGFGKDSSVEWMENYIKTLPASCYYKMLLWELPRGIVRLVMAIPAGLRMLKRGLFAGAGHIAGFFLMIHSEIRLLCGVDAAIGAAVGYHYHSVFIGMVAGALWGVLNFEILSIRVLKCIPASRSIFY